MDETNLMTEMKWKHDLPPREQAQIAHAVAYALNWQDAGVPGHGQFVLIAKLAKKLDDLEYATYPPKLAIDG